jgi:hypothetical protein
MPGGKIGWPRRGESRGTPTRRLLWAVTGRIPVDYAPPMASAELSRRVASVAGYPPLCEMNDLQRREFHEALLEADAFEDLPGKWQAAILRAEQSRPKLRIVSGD